MEQIVPIIISAFSSLIAAMGVAYIRSYFDKKANDAKIEAAKQEQILRQEISEQKQKDELSKFVLMLEERMLFLEKKFDTLIYRFDIHTDDGEFRLNFRNKLTTQSNDTYKFSQLNAKYHNALDEWCELITEYGISYYYSEERKKGEPESTLFLHGKETKLIDSFRGYINRSITTPKNLYGKRVVFNDYLDKMEIYTHLKVLNARLAENGLDFQEYIKKFANHILNFNVAFLKHVKSWLELSDYTMKTVNDD